MISVVIPTFNRPDGLKRAVESVFAQTYATKGFELIVVDNTPDATAGDMISALRANCPETINFIALHEPAAGVANARNCAMQAVSYQLVAFLDDDQSAPADWLTELLKAHNAHPAAVTFGPVETKLPEGQRRHEDYFKSFFARDPHFNTGYIDTSFGCGNALIDFSKVPGKHPWFDVAMNETGGEDDVLFGRISDAFGRFAWAEQARVFEHPGEARVALRYTLRRAFSYGQAPITLARREGRANPLLIGFWMLVGAVKAATHSSIWVAQSLIRHPKRAFHLDQTVRGIGKLLWWIDLHFYGAAVLQRKAANRDCPASPKLSTKAERA